MRFSISEFAGLNQNDQEEALIGRAYQGSQGGVSQRAPLEAIIMKNIDFTQGGITKRKGSTEANDLTGVMTNDELIKGWTWTDPVSKSTIEINVSKKTIFTDEDTPGTFVQIKNAAGSNYAHNSDVSKASFAEVDGHLFIGLDGANNYVQVYRSGDALDDYLFSSTLVTDVSEDSASGAKNLFVTTTSIFNVGQKIIINEGGSKEETNYIASIDPGVKLITETNLVNTHNAQAWTIRVPTTTPHNYILGGVAYGGGIFVAVGQADGTDAYILTSPTGITWTKIVPVTTPHNFDLVGITYGDGLFVAVGVADGTRAYILTSPDGVTWTKRTATIDRDWDLKDVAYGNGVYVAVGDASGATLARTYMLSSPDGITWTEVFAPTNNNTDLNSVTWGNGLFVAVGNGSYILTSLDGKTWVEEFSETGAGVNYESVIYGNDLYVVVGTADGTNPGISTSPDGITWTTRTPLVAKNEDLNGITFGEGLFVAVGNAYTTFPYILISVDGIIWRTDPTEVSKNNNLLACTYGAGKFALVGPSDGTDAYILTALKATFVGSNSQYTEAFDTSTTHEITGTWDDATYIVAAFQSRLLTSFGNTIFQFTPEAFTSLSGIWDLVNGGFLQAAGNIRSINPFAPKFADQINEALYIGTDVGFDVTTGFTVVDRLIRIEGARAPINHNSVAEALNWLVYLTDDKNIMAINGASVINLGRRMKSPDKTGVLDNMVVSTSELKSYGFYNQDKSQCIFGFNDSDDDDNSNIAIIDFALGEPAQNEPQSSFEQRVRCLYWHFGGEADMFNDMYQTPSGAIGLKGDGFLYLTESGYLDLTDHSDVNNILTEWQSPVFNGGSQELIKQWFSLSGRLLRPVSTNPALVVKVYLNRSTTAYGTQATWTMTGASPAKQVSKQREVYTISEAISIELTSTDALNWVLYNLVLGYDIGAEIIT